MRGFVSQIALRFLFLFLICSISLLSLSVPGLAGDPSSSSKDANKAADQGGRSSSVVFKVAIVIVGAMAVIAFSVFLFKIWQKKKRDEQHSRLLKLFEDDDELEVELGIRD